MKNRIRKSLLIFLSLYLFLPFQLLSGNPTKPSKDDCLVCHSDKDISKVEKGKTISLWVNQSQLAHSVHGRMLCVDCHKDFNPDDIPHKENIQPPECFSCHKDFAKKHTFHPQMAFFTPGSNSVLFDCKKCHGTHGISKPEISLSKPGATNAVEFCGSCHKEQKEQHIKSEHYAAYLKNNPNAPTCTYCHSKPITKYW
ncbi:MAG: hypothetical protein QG635_194, partial [Bacteroidota bacterium]|nr:hypothetical protein [Bacteroidota bacterium]